MIGEANGPAEPSDGRPAAVLAWTGVEAKALRAAQRRSIRGFASHLGVSTSAVSSWEARGRAARLRTETQQLLDLDLAQSDGEVQRRFATILAGNHAVERGSAATQEGVAFAPAAASRGDGSAITNVGWLWANGMGLPDRPWSGSEAIASLDQWRCDGQPHPVAPFGGDRRVGLVEVEVVRAMSVAFAEADHRLGGGHACDTLVHYATAVVQPMLRARFDERVGRLLFAAVARLCDLAGFMCFDSGRHGLGQEFFGLALRLVTISGDRVLEAHILADMAIQAHYLGQTRNALAIAEAGADAARRTDSASTLARCLAIQARALAQAGDAAGCGSAVNRAEVALGHAQEGDEPEWIKFFTIQQLATESMYVAADLGRPQDVRRHAVTALMPVAAMQRRQVLAAATLAEAHLSASRSADLDVEQACHILGGVAEVLPSLTSARALHAVNTVRRRLARYASHPAVVQVEQELRASTRLAA